MRKDISELDFFARFRYDNRSYGDAGNSNLVNEDLSEPERVEDRRMTGEGRSQTAGGKVRRRTQ